MLFTDLAFSNAKRKHEQNIILHFLIIPQQPNHKPYNTMHSHFLILAILSLRALAGIILTAYDHTDWQCKHKAIGNKIDLSGPGCVVYQPEQPDAYIHVEWFTDILETSTYDVSIFSDLSCKDLIGTIFTNINETGSQVNLDYSDTCTGMGLIADGPWGSAIRSHFTNNSPTQRI